MTLVAAPPPAPTTEQVAPSVLPVDERVRSLYLSPDTFRHWLETLPPGRLVGARWEAQSCPLATFGVKTLGPVVGGLSVHADHIYLLAGGRSSEAGLRTVPTPPWCRHFLWAVDDNPVPLISAGLALRLLRALEEEAPL